MFLGACLFSGYAYARLQNDEVLRRLFYCRYANFITYFDIASPIFEDFLKKCYETYTRFDSSYLFWYFKTSKIAEYRAYRKLEGEIFEKEAERGDDISRALLELEKEIKER